MTSTDRFKQVIQIALDEIAKNDPLFAEVYKKENKNIEDCVTFILIEVQKSGYHGFADSEIIGMAMHYYDENDIAIGSRPEANIVVNHAVELTPDEIEETKARAKEKLIEAEITRMKMKKQKKSEPKIIQTEKEDLSSGLPTSDKPMTVIQGSLFG